MYRKMLDRNTLYVHLVLTNYKAYTGFDINSCPIARGKWKWHPTCPIGQVKMILWYVQFLKSKMINIEVFSVGSHIASYVSCILHYFVDYGISLSQIKIVLFILANRECLIRRRRCINIVFIFAGQWKARVICGVLILENYPWLCIAFTIKILKQTIQSLSVYDKEHLYLNFLAKIFWKSSSIAHIYKTHIPANW